MPAVEVRIAPAAVTAFLAEMRRWCDARGITPTFRAAADNNELLIIFDFDDSNDAQAFARAFAGTLIAT
jgi:hypothetical protein